MSARASTGSGPAPPVGRAAPSAAATPQTARWQFIRTLEILSRRRRYVLDRRGQLRAVVMAGSVSAVLLALLNAALYVARERGAAALLADAPELRELIVSQSRMELLIVAAMSLLFLAGVVLITIVETHRTAGAAFNLARHMGAVQAGHYDIALRLREGDNLRDLETAFNDMTRALLERAENDALQLEQLAVAADELTGPDTAARLAERIRERAHELRSSAR